MGEFFHGWRRKMGVVTLVMALTLMAGWMRSLSVTDVVTVCGGNYGTDDLWSWNGYLAWMRSHFVRYTC